MHGILLLIAAVHTTSPAWAPSETPAAVQARDPGDSLYRAAREALNRNDYQRAAELFQRLHEGHPRATYAGDALYWEAFSRYRLGGADELRRARERLRQQGERYAAAGTRRDAR
ncbi:MAG: hypothetical protein ACREMJ_04645, partial [Gemmatimonadales bacterium]